MPFGSKANRNRAQTVRSVSLSPLHPSCLPPGPPLVELYRDPGGKGELKFAESSTTASGWVAWTGGQRQQLDDQQHNVPPTTQYSLRGM